MRITFHGEQPYRRYFLTVVICIPIDERIRGVAESRANATASSSTGYQNAHICERAHQEGNPGFTVGGDFGRAARQQGDFTRPAIAVLASSNNQLNSPGSDEGLASSSLLALPHEGLR